MGLYIQHIFGHASIYSHCKNDKSLSYVIIFTCLVFLIYHVLIHILFICKSNYINKEYENKNYLCCHNIGMLF